MTMRYLKPLTQSLRWITWMFSVSIFSKLLGDGEIRKLAVEHLLHKVYGSLKLPKS